MTLRLAVRLARREVRRRRGRTALVALLVALPVAGMVVALTLQQTSQRTPVEEWRETHGTFDLETPGQPLPELPEGASTLAVQTAFTRVEAEDGGRAFVDLTDVPLGDPRLAGTTRVVDGRPPRGDREVAISPDLADALGVGVGDTVDLVGPAMDADVVGVVEQPSCLSCRRVVVAPGWDLRPGTPDTSGAPVPSGQVDVRLLIDLPPGLTDAQLDRLADAQRFDGPPLWAGRPTGGTDTSGAMVWTFVAGGLVLSVAGIVIAAAFAVGARRQLATLGQLSANGAAPLTLSATLVLQGTVTGLVGGALGVVLAWGALLGGRHQVEAWLDRRIDGYAVAPWALAGAVAVGVLAATVAALLPARTAAYVPTLQAMAGRRPLSRVPRRFVVGGILSVAAGLGLLAVAVLGSQGGSSSQVWAALAVAGGTLELLGACAASPVVAARLEPLARHLYGSGRLAARSLARQRTRSGAVIAAVCAAGALAVCAAAAVRGVEAKGLRHGVVPPQVVLASTTMGGAPRPTPGGGVLYVPERPSRAAAREVARALPQARAVPVRVAVGPWEQTPAPVRWTTGTVADDVAVVADDAVLDAFEVDEDAREVLEDRGVVVLHERAADVTVTLPDGRSWDTRSVPTRYGPAGLSAVLVTPEAARHAAVEVRSGAAAFRNPDPLTADESDALSELLYDGTLRTTAIEWSRPPTGPSPFVLQLLLSGAALVFSVLVVGASLALAAAESRDERDALTLAGAPPRTLARVAGAKAWLLSGLGGLLALPIGFLPVAVFSAVDRDDFPLRVPWPTVAALIAAVPLVAAVVAWVSSGAAQRIRPVRVSTVAWD